MMKRRVFAACLCLLLSSLLAFNCLAKEVKQEKAYNPLDLVVVVDASGSMADCDPHRTALAAVRMLVNMMPAMDSRVGIISFNTDPTVLTKDSSGNNALIGLDSFVGVETVRSDVSGINYKGRTGIGNAVKAATELLEKCSDSSHTRAIMLFTDGVNDFGRNPVALAQCEENEVDAIQWADRNGCSIYCMGYDYVDGNGKRSMGDGGEGIVKLQNISDSTGGSFKVIKSITDIEQMLINFLADVCDLNYKTIATIPGDGGYHECSINVSPSVVEANIRIAGGGANAIKEGRIHLYDPSGKEVQLINSGNVRFDADATAASIKVIMPTPGEWRLTVDGINGDDIHVGLLEHFKMNLTSELIFPDGNPENVAYTNDVIGIRTWLSYEDGALDNDDIYNAVTSATATCIPRANPDDQITITLTREGRSFAGSFVIAQDSFYDIHIRLDWDTVYREDTLEVWSENSPVKVIKQIEDVSVNKGKTITLDNIFQYVRDEEGDPLTVSVLSLSNPKAANFTVNGDSIDITGVQGWFKSTRVTLQFSDIPGNPPAEISFKVTVGDPWAWVVIGAIALGLVIALVVVLRAIKRLFDFVPGYIRVKAIADGHLEGETFVMTKPIYINPNISDDADYSIPPAGGGDDDDETLELLKVMESGGESVLQPDEDDENGNGAEKQKQGVSPKEKRKSDLFNQAIQLSRFGTKKMILSDALKQFAEDYRVAMNVDLDSDDGKSVLGETVSEQINRYYLSPLSGFKMIGTSFGNNGSVLKTPKSVVPKTVLIHSPFMEKNQIRLAVNKGDILLSLSIKQEQKDKEEHTLCHHLEIIYTQYE